MKITKKQLRRIIREEKARLLREAGTPADRGFGQVIEAFQYGFEQEQLCDYDDKSQPIHHRLFRGPNTWPEDESLPGFRPLIDELNACYHRLTHELGEAIVESLGEDVESFRRYFDFDNPDLAASLNHNFSIDAFALFVASGFRSSHLSYLKDANTTGLVKTPKALISFKNCSIRLIVNPTFSHLFFMGL